MKRSSKNCVRNPQELLFHFTAKYRLSIPCVHATLGFFEAFTLSAFFFVIFLLAIHIVQNQILHKFHLLLSKILQLRF